MHSKLKPTAYWGQTRLSCRPHICSKLVSNLNSFWAQRYFIYLCFQELLETVQVGKLPLCWASTLRLSATNLSQRERIPACIINEFFFTATHWLCHTPQQPRFLFFLRYSCLINACQSWEMRFWGKFTTTTMFSFLWLREPWERQLPVEGATAFGAVVLCDLEPCWLTFPSASSMRTVTSLSAHGRILATKCLELRKCSSPETLLSSSIFRQPLSYIYCCSRFLTPRLTRLRLAGMAAVLLQRTWAELVSSGSQIEATCSLCSMDFEVQTGEKDSL